MTKEEFIAAQAGQLYETPLLYYVGGYKYQSRNDMIYQTFIYPPDDIVTDLIVLRKDGWMWLGKYFAWDGASGPTLDTPANMPASQAHDGLYALFRMGLLPLEWRPAADSVLSRLMLRDGAARFRARYYEWAVNKFAVSAANPRNAKPVMVAPQRINLPGLAPG